jgi:hypothetical protein
MTLARRWKPSKPAAKRTRKREILKDRKQRKKAKR